MDSQIQVILNTSNMLSFTLYLFHLYELKVISLGVSVSELRSLCYIRQLYYCTTANQNKHINNPNILKSKSSLSLFFGVLCLLRFELGWSIQREELFRQEACSLIVPITGYNSGVFTEYLFFSKFQFKLDFKYKWLQNINPKQ